MSRCTTFTFQVSIMSKWLAKHISTKVSFKITIMKRHVYIYIRWPWKWNQYFYLGIWNVERTKIILNVFICVEVTILCKKVKYVWSSHFPEAITTNIQIGYDSFVFKYPVTWQTKNFKIHINFIEINVNVCLLCALHVMTSIILHTRRPNCQ